VTSLEQAIAVLKLWRTVYHADSLKPLNL